MAYTAAECPARHSSDVQGATIDDLSLLAFLRIVEAADRNCRLPRLFPSDRTFCGATFSSEDHRSHCHLDCEYGRLLYTLCCLPDRRPPQVVEVDIDAMLDAPSVLLSWTDRVDIIRAKTDECFRAIRQRMTKQRSPLRCGSSPLCTSIPQSYQPMGSSDKCVRLLDQAIFELGMFDDRISNDHDWHSFLSIYAFLRDPIGGLHQPIGSAVGWASQFAQVVSVVRRDRYATSRLAAVQIAFEAMYLGCPLLEDTAHIHFCGKQQLTYVFVKLAGLKRSELSIPKHVLEMMREILETEPLSMIPITVAMYPDLTPQGAMRTIIIDGNHRVTAIALLRLIAEEWHDWRQVDRSKELLSAYCARHRLCHKWHCILMDVLLCLQSDAGQPYAALIEKHASRVALFKYLERVPALLVEEECYHTACMQRPPVRSTEHPATLLPCHQAIYNDNELALVLPHAGQVHGRTAGFQMIALPFERATIDRRGKGACQDRNRSVWCNSDRAISRWLDEQDF